MNDDKSQCQCDMLKLLSQGPEAAIQFDEELREYHISYNGSVWILRFCPFCGNELTGSIRSDLFASIDDEEVKLLNERLKMCKTVKEIKRKIGPPDDDFLVEVEGENDFDGCPSSEMRYLCYDSVLGGGRVFILTQDDNITGICFQPKLLHDG